MNRILRTRPTLRYRRLTGFSIGEADMVIGEVAAASPEGKDATDDASPEIGDVAVTKPGDIWQLDRHRLVCGDSQDASVYAALLGTDKVDMVFTDPPYNVPIDGHVSGLGQTKHREFAFASGEMSKGEFTAFLKTTLGHAAAACRDGAIAFVCMDWRHMSLRPGARLIREWNGETHEVLVTEEGFQWRGQKWRSLSAIAREITGTHWSGPRFFGVRTGRSHG